MDVSSPAVLTGQGHYGIPGRSGSQAKRRGRYKRAPVGERVKHRSDSVHALSLSLSSELDRQRDKSGHRSSNFQKRLSQSGTRDCLFWYSLPPAAKNGYFKRRNCPIGFPLSHRFRCAISCPASKGAAPSRAMLPHLILTRFTAFFFNRNSPTSTYGESGEITAHRIYNRTSFPEHDRGKRESAPLDSTLAE